MENTSIQVSGNEIANILNEVRVSPEEARKWLEQNIQPYKELMAYYRCAIMEIETKFNVLNEELSLKYDRNPIETIKSRLKSPESIAEKMRRKNIFPTVQTIEDNLTDIAGIRVICSFPADIYMLEKALLDQDDVRLVEK